MGRERALPEAWGLSQDSAAQQAELPVGLDRPCRPRGCPRACHPKEAQRGGGSPGPCLLGYPGYRRLPCSGQAAPSLALRLHA